MKCALAGSGIANENRGIHDYGVDNCLGPNALLIFRCPASRDIEPDLHIDVGE